MKDITRRDALKLGAALALMAGAALAWDVAENEQGAEERRKEPPESGDDEPPH